MKAGDIKYHNDTNIKTGIKTTIEEIVTQKMVDDDNKAEAIKVEEERVKAIYDELDSLDKIVSREYENTYLAYEEMTKETFAFEIVGLDKIETVIPSIIKTNPLYWNEKMQSAVEKKKELRIQL